MDVDLDEWMTVAEATAWIVSRDEDLSWSLQFASPDISAVMGLNAWRKAGNSFVIPIDAARRQLAYECGRGRVKARGRKVGMLGATDPESSVIDSAEWLDTILFRDDLVSEARHAPIRKSVAFSRVDMTSVFPTKALALPSAAGGRDNGRRRGRPPAADWPRVKKHVFNLMDEHGDFSPDDPEWGHQARLEEAVADFIQSIRGEAPAASVVRSHCSIFAQEWRALKAADKSAEK